MRLTLNRATIKMREIVPVGKKGEDLYRKIDWNTVTIKNNFLFQETLRNEKICKDFLNRVLHIQVKTIRYLETEKTMTAQLRSKNARLDVYVEDKSGNVSDIEMQVTGKKSVLYNDVDEKTVIRELPLRVRYYQNVIGTNMLRKGMHYRELKKAYVIFVCTFDPFGEGLPVYHFTYRCKEQNDLQMSDLTENIFLNTKAADKAEDKELAAFLRYVENQKTTTRFTKELDKEAMRIRNNDDWRLKVMTLDMEIQDMKRRMELRARKKYEAKGKAEGRKEGEQKAKIEFIRNMRAEGMDDALIAKVMKLSEKELAELA